MPLGKNIGFEFDGNNPQIPSKTYEFDSSNTAPVGEGESFTFDFYHGAESNVKFFVNTQHNLPLLEGGNSEYNQEFSYNFDDSYGTLFGQNTDVELTTYPAVTNPNIDFNLNDVRYGQTVKPVDPTNLTLLTSGNDLTPITSSLRFEYEDYSSQNAGSLRHNQTVGSNLEVELEIECGDGGFTGAQAPTYDINLSSGTPSYDINLDDGSYQLTQCGKNLNWDFNLCDTNPALTSTPHVFEYHADYDYDCEQDPYQIYNGQTLDFDIVTSIEIENVEGFGGQYSDADLQTFQVFDADAYSGAHSDADLDTYPPAELEPDAYHGGYGDADLFITAIIRDTDAYHGGYGGADLSTFPPPTLDDIDAYHGSNTDVDMENFPQFDGDSYHGSYADLDFTTFEPAELDADAYHGGYGDADLENFPQFDAEAPTGGYGDLDLTIAPSEGIGIVDAHHGSYGEADIAPAENLPSDAYHGLSAEFELATTTSFDVDAYYGEYGDADFTEGESAEFILDAYHGGLLEFDISRSLTLHARAYHGGYGDLDFTDFPSTGVGNVDAYHGSYVETFELGEFDDWSNTYGYHGAYGEVDLLSTPGFIADGHFDIGAEMELFTDVNLGSLAEHGSYVDLDFTDVPGESLQLDFYHGAYGESDSDIRLHVTFTPHPIVASQNLRDGWGGVGGLNHCESNNLTPYGDTAIRFPYSNRWDGIDPIPDDDFDIEFAEFGDRPWNACSDNHIVCSFDLLIRPRFDFEPMVHGASTKLFMPKEYMALCDGTPDELVQRDNYGAMDIPEEPWYRDCCVPTFSSSSGVDWFFEPIEYMRFCKGYIIPNGNSVLFEFDGHIDYDCEQWYATGGEECVFELQSNSHFMNDEVFEHGVSATATMVTEDAMSLIAHHGHRAGIDNPIISPAEISHGSNFNVTLYEPNIYAHNGAYMEDTDLVVPGPGVQWLTESGCLINEYLPLTDSGDIDYIALDADTYKEEFPPSAVENRFYRFFFDAVCAGVIPEDS